MKTGSHIKTTMVSAGWIQPICCNTRLKSYWCPFCSGLIMKGNIRRLAMACPICNRLIRADEADLVLQ